MGAGIRVSHVLPDGRVLVFAHEEEAQAFQKIPHFVTGIGKVSASVALAKLLNDEPVREIIVLGTAGMINDGLKLDTVYRVRRAIQHDLAFNPPIAELSGAGEVTMVGRVPGAVALGGAGVADAGADDSAHSSATANFDANQPSAEQTAVIATGDTFVTDDAVRQKLAAQGAGLVDMESYAFAALASGFQVPLRIFKVPSDFADSGTTDETWDQIVSRKSAQLLDFAQASRLL